MHGSERTPGSPSTAHRKLARGMNPTVALIDLIEAWTMTSPGLHVVREALEEDRDLTKDEAAVVKADLALARELQFTAYGIDPENMN